MERNTRSVRAPGRFLVVACTLLLVAGRASAHDIKMIVDPVPDPIQILAFFDDDTPAQDARVYVLTSEGAEVAAGVTDERGVWSFKKPGPGSYRITVESIGHKTSALLTIPGGEQPQAQAEVEPEPRVVNDNRLGLIVGLTLTLGGSLAFIVLRRLRANAPGSPPAARP